jgi:hypothetical protein
MVQSVLAHGGTSAHNPEQAQHDERGATDNDSPAEAAYPFILHIYLFLQRQQSWRRIG